MPNIDTKQFEYCPYSFDKNFEEIKVKNLQELEVFCEKIIKNQVDLFEIEGAPMAKYYFSCDYEDDKSLIVHHAPHSYMDGMSNNKVMYFMSDEYVKNGPDKLPEEVFTRAAIKNINRSKDPNFAHFNEIPKKLE